MHSFHGMIELNNRAKRRIRKLIYDTFFKHKQKEMSRYKSHDQKVLNCWLPITQ